MSRAATNSRSVEPAHIRRWKNLVAGLVATAAGALCLGAVSRQAGDASGASEIFKVAFFASIGALLIGAPVLRGLWRGQVHITRGKTRAIPFEASEMLRRHHVHPGAASHGVGGRAGLLGYGLIAVGVVVWLAGLAFMPADSTGIMRVAEGETAHRLELFGMSHRQSVIMQHTVEAVRTDAVAVSVMDPRTQEEGSYLATPAQHVLLGDHRITLKALYPLASEGGVRLRARQGVWPQPFSGAAGYLIGAIPGPGRTQTRERELVLRPNRPATLGQWSWQLLGSEAEFMSTAFRGYQVLERGPRGERIVWLLTEGAGVDYWLGDGDPHLSVDGVVYPTVVELRFTQAWVWWWRVVTLIFGGVGIFLALLVPHVSWQWTGRPGDFRLHVWSLGASSHLGAWLDENVRALLGDAGFTELAEIEAELAAGARPV